MTLYQKVLAVVGMLRTSISQRASKMDLAPMFNPEVSYAVDKMVVYENVLYRCTHAHTGEWDADDFATCTLDEMISLISVDRGIVVVPDFDAETSYGLGFLVAKGGVLQRCIQAGVGNSAVFEETTLNAIIRYGLASYATLVEEGDVSVSLADSELKVLDMTQNTIGRNSGDMRVIVDLPPVGDGSKVVDALLRVDTFGNPFRACSVVLHKNGTTTSPEVVVASSDMAWSSVDVNTMNVFTFTYVGRDTWLVGKASVYRT